jgi:hypothetical protein
MNRHALRLARSAGLIRRHDLDCDESAALCTRSLARCAPPIGERAAMLLLFAEDVPSPSRNMHVESRVDVAEV